MDTTEDSNNKEGSTASIPLDNGDDDDGESQPLITKHEEGDATLPARIRWFVYFSHALSAWGDRMWQFGVGLFLVIIAPGSLRLTAIYGLCTGGATLLFGTLVGDWVDQTPRLRAAQTTLILQNMSVLLCSGVVFAVITYQETIAEVWPDGRLVDLCYGVIILLAVIASLASMGTTIAIERDWIIEICDRHTDTLASMSATLRRIDLLTNIVAPIVTGQVMAYGSESIGALFIGGWNLVSVFVEYYLLWKVYNMVPALHLKMYRDDVVKEDIRKCEERVSVSEDMANKTCDDDKYTQDHNGGDNEQHSAEVHGNLVFKNEWMENNPPYTKDTTSVTDPVQQHRQSTCGTKCGSCLMKVFSGVVSIGRGWKTYMKYDVAFAGIALATLYMTVLGFDNVTVGYAYSQGVNESIMGVLMAAGALTGILGTVVYPGIKRALGLQRTGLLGMFLEVSVLCLCVLSVWAPGSPFDPFHTENEAESVAMETNISLVTNMSTFVNVSSTKDDMNFTYLPVNTFNESTTVKTSALDNSSSVSPFVTMATSNASTNVSPVTDGQGQMYLSVGLLMAGIIGARCGLWLTDLTVTQLFLETVSETERGVANGVQMSLNMLMDMLKFLLVIIIPDPSDFGFLILISFGFTVFGWALYAKYSYTTRGHLVHLDKLVACMRRNNNIREVRNEYSNLKGDNLKTIKKSLTPSTLQTNKQYLQTL